MHNKIYLSDLCQVWSLVALCAFIMCIHYVHSCCAATTITGLQNFFIVWNWHFVPLNNNFLRNFLMVQWLGFSAFTPVGLGLIPCQGTKISQVMSCGMAKKEGFVLSLSLFFFFFLMWGLWGYFWYVNGNVMFFSYKNVVESMFLRNVSLESQHRTTGTETPGVGPASVLANPATQSGALLFWHILLEPLVCV